MKCLTTLDTSKATPVQFRRFFSTDNPKALKAQKLGWLNAINYLAPHRLAGVGNLCPNASAGCVALCLVANTAATQRSIPRCSNHASPKRSTSCATARRSCSRWPDTLQLRRTAAKSWPLQALRAIERRDRYRLGSDWRFRKPSHLTQTSSSSTIPSRSNAHFGACARPIPRQLSPDIQPQRNQRSTMPRGAGRGR